MISSLRPFYATILLLCALPACVDTHGLPKLPPYGEEYYPRPSRRIGEEGRVLVEFHLDQNGQLTAQPTVSRPFWWEANARLEEAALKLVKTLPPRLASSDHFKPDPTRTYRVTIIYCLDSPGNSENRFSPFDNTMPIVVKATRITVDPTISEFWQQN